MRTHRHTTRRKTKVNNHRQSEIGKIEQRLCDVERRVRLFDRSVWKLFPPSMPVDMEKRFEDMVWTASGTS